MGRSTAKRHRSDGESCARARALARRGRRCSCSRTPLQRRPRARPRTQSLASRATEHVKKRRAEPTLFSRTRKRKSASVRVRSTTRGQEPKIDMGRRSEMFRRIEKSKCSTCFLCRADRQLVARDWRARSFLFYIKIWISESRTDIFMRLIARTAFRFRALLARRLRPLLR